jgi:hypothetical protein
MPAVRGSRAKRAWPNRLQTELFQQTGHTTRTAGFAWSSQFHGDPPSLIPPFMLPEDLPHQGPQPNVFLFAEADTALGIGIVTRATDAQSMAYRRHGETLFFQVRDDGIGLFQVPWLKMAKAFF